MYVYATATASVGWDGGIVRLRQNDPWYADDPFVKANPEFFTKTPPTVMFTAPRVERATANPGEKRGGK